MKDFLKAIDVLALHVLQEGVQPIAAGTDIAYEAGRRIGIAQGVQRARSAIINAHTKDQDHDKDL
jgi:hypothetical protein